MPMERRAVLRMLHPRLPVGPAAAVRRVARVDPNDCLHRSEAWQGT